VASIASVSAGRAVLAGAFAQNRLRTAIAVLAIALGVALGFAVQLINGSAVDALSQSVRTVSGDADLVVRGPRSGFDEALFATFARDPEVAVASPAVEVEARLAGRTDSLRIIGLDLFRAAAIQPGLVAEAGEGLDMLPADGRVLFYARSRDYWRAEPISKELVARGRMRHVETFKTLEIYVKG